MYATSLKNRHFPTNKAYRWSRGYMTRCSASLVIKGNADQKHKRYHLLPVWMASTKNVRKDKCYWGWGEKGVLMHYW